MNTLGWDYFTTAYFHRPDELQAEVVSVGFNCQAVLGLEGPGWILSDVARALEREVSLVGLSAHLLAVGTKK